MRSKRGQLSVEVSIFLVIFLIIFIVIFMNSLSQVSITKTQVSNYIIRDTLSDLASSAKRVYVGGSNSLEVVRVQFPNDINRTIINTTLIGIITKPTISTEKQYLHDVDVPVGGSLPNSSGIYDINVTSNGTTVLFSYIP